MGLVSKILQAEPDLKIPVPIEDLAGQLDIEDIQPLKTEGFLGGLVTNEARTLGFVLVKDDLRLGRRRFTIAHELGHFLCPSHKLTAGDRFLCTRKAMSVWDVKASDTNWRIEAEANRFAALILIPPPVLRPFLARKRYADLNTVLEMHRMFAVSKEMAARAYAEYFHEPVAVLITRHGKLRYAYRHKEFPRLDLERGQPLPEISIVQQHKSLTGLTSSDSTDPAHWIDERDVQTVIALYEQVLPQANGFAMVQLKAILRDEEDRDEDEDLTSKQRFARRMEKWR
ncbi:MAG: ImmA/IrrE family metallo-endopeptidase [Maricaulaceae bacterium]